MILQVLRSRWWRACTRVYRGQPMPGAESISRGAEAGSATLPPRSGGKSTGLKAETTETPTCALFLA